jgi:ATP-dependent DNA ligase
MNIFEAIGLPHNHREPDRCTMKVKHWDKVPARKKNKREYIAQVKYDGIYCHVVKSGSKFKFFSRSGLELSNTRRLERILLDQQHNADQVIFIAELCCDECSLEELSGLFSPNRVASLSLEQAAVAYEAYLVYHDILTFEEYRKGVSRLGYVDRYLELLNAVGRNANLLIKSDRVDSDAVEQYADYCINLGEEGAVFKTTDGLWRAGYRGVDIMKIVKQVSYDLECIGVEEGEGKYKGKIANLLFKWKDGQTIKAMLGEGWTHQDAKDMWESPSTYIGKVYKVYALQESSKGKLRLPKVGERRFDKEADF